MTPAQQATAELHAAFFNIPYTATLVSMSTLAQTLPARRRNLMQQEVKELCAIGMTRVSREDSRGRT